MGLTYRSSTTWSCSTISPLHHFWSKVSSLGNNNDSWLLGIKTRRMGRANGTPAITACAKSVCCPGYGINNKNTRPFARKRRRRRRRAFTCCAHHTTREPNSLRWRRPRWFFFLFCVFGARKSVIRRHDSGRRWRAAKRIVKNNKYDKKKQRRRRYNGSARRTHWNGTRMILPGKD